MFGTNEKQMSDKNLARGNFGVVCSLVEQPDGKIRLVLDDASSPASRFPQAWQTLTPFTSKDYGESEFLGVALSEEELADIGMNLVARLSALAAHRKRGGQGGISDG
jgi:hypothetical protein